MAGFLHREKIIHHFIAFDRDLHPGKSVMLSEDESKHLVKSLRLKKGDLIRLVNGDGHYYVSRIVGCKKDVEVSILEIQEPEKSKEYQTFAVIPVIKKSRFELLLEKLTELGIDRIIPYYPLQGSFSKNSLTRRMMQRWESIILSAVKQSKRATFPIVADPDELEAVLEKEQDNSAEKILLDIGEASLESRIAGNLRFITGPEGGFSQREKQIINKMGYKSVSISDMQLRTETAAMLMCGIIEFLRR